MDAATPAAITLSDADCRSFSTAPALGVAVVVANSPDCSGVGHLRIVLELTELARGDAIRTIVASRPLHGPDDGARFRKGDTVVVAVAPAREAARTVSCVSLPASDGIVRHAVTVDGADAGRRVLAAIIDGSACPASSASH